MATFNFLDLHHLLAMERWTLRDWWANTKRSSSRVEGVTSPSGWSYRDIVLPQIWLVNDFPSKMMKDAFGRLHLHFQIPEDVLIRKACRGKMSHEGDEWHRFLWGILHCRLTLPFSYLHRWLADYLGISIYQIAPNAWRIFIGDEVLWG